MRDELGSRVCETEHLCAELGRIFAEPRVGEANRGGDAVGGVAAEVYGELNRAAIGRAAAILAGGGTVAFPTETVYGLGANALDEAAVGRIFAAKQRPRWDPLIVHVADLSMLECVTELPAAILPQVEALMAAFWPGPLTLLLPRSRRVPDVVTAGRSLVGVRMPAHPVALELIRRAGVPIAAPSANRFGYTSPTCAAHVMADLEGRIDAILDGGWTTVGVESTVLDLSQTPPVVYRPGAVTLEAMGAVLGVLPVVYRAGVFASGAAMVDAGGRAVNAGVEPESLPSPGVGIRHYAPRARVVLVRGSASSERLTLAIRELLAGEAKVGVMLPEGWVVPGNEGLRMFAWGGWGDHAELARRLFEGLRALDAADVTAIVCPVPDGDGVAEAIRDRLEKAARTE